MPLIHHTDLDFPIINQVHANRHLFVISLVRANTPHRVLQKVDQDQLDLQRVGKDCGRVVCRFAANTAPSILGFRFHHPDHLFDQRTKRHGQQLHVARTNQRPNALGNGSRPFGLFLNLLEEFDELRFVIDIVLKASLDCLRIVLNRNQRLVDLMGYSGGHSAQAVLFAKTRQSPPQVGCRSLRLTASAIFIL